MGFNRQAHAPMGSEIRRESFPASQLNIRQRQNQRRNDTFDPTGKGQQRILLRLILHGQDLSRPHLLRTNELPRVGGTRGQPLCLRVVILGRRSALRGGEEMIVSPDSDSSLNLLLAQCSPRGDRDGDCLILLLAQGSQRGIWVGKRLERRGNPWPCIRLASHRAPRW